MGHDEPGGETLSEHGYSKDYWPDLKQMILGLVVDGDGRPTCTESPAIWRTIAASYRPFAAPLRPPRRATVGGRLLDPKALERGFAAWAPSLRPLTREVVAIDGKTLRGSRQSNGTGALHLVSAYASAAGLVLAQSAVDGKSNEITAIPELLDMLNTNGAIVSIDTMGTQKKSPRASPDKGADYVLGAMRDFR